VEGSKPYPRTYSVHASTLRGLDAAATIPLALVIAFSILQLAVPMAEPVSGIDLFVAGFIAALYTVLLCNLNHRRVILYEDGIAVRSWVSSRRLNRTDILGRRMGRLAWQAGGGSSYIIVPVDKSAKELRLPPFLRLDTHFHSWMKGIPLLGKQG